MELGSTLVSQLADASVRSVCLGLLGAVALGASRTRSASARHAVWTLVLCGMLLLPVLAAWAPALAVRVLPATGQAVLPPPLPPPSTAMRAAPSPALPPARQWPGWREILAGLYAAGAAVFAARLVFGYLFTRRLVRGSVPIEGGSDPDLLESRWISVPMTVGWLRPRILLPAEWRTWAPDKLEAVLIHERNHVRRCDWLIFLLAGANKALFWFHPLAWWLEQRLAVLAEQACDDSALLELGDREQYARALLDMAAAVRSGQGRLAWEAMAMAKPAQVRARIERVLDESRTLSQSLTKRGWAALALAGVPLLYGAAAVSLEQAQGPASEPMQLMVEGTKLTAAEAQRVEAWLQANPEDLAARGRLLAYYLQSGQREPWLKHLTWMIEHHPESETAGMNSSAVTPSHGLLNTEADYARIKDLWLAATRSRANDPQVLWNAARFFGETQTAEDLLKQLRQLQPTNRQVVDRLAVLYAAAFRNPETAGRVRSELEASTDVPLLMATAMSLTSMRQTEAAEAVQKRAEQLGAVVHRMPTPATRGPRKHVPWVYPEAARAAGIEGNVRLKVTVGADGRVQRVDAIEGHPLLVQAMEEAVRQWEYEPRAQPFTIEMVGHFGLPGQARAITGSGQAQPLSPAPPLSNRVEPVYPPLARQARIQGTVRMQIVIGTDGHVQNIQLISGHPLLVQAAREAVMRWVYEPQAQPVTTNVDVAFTLPPEDRPVVVATTGEKPAVPSRIRVGGGVQANKLVNKVEPIYPPLAKQARIQGTVRFNIVIAPDGHFTHAELVNGHPLLVPAALEAIKQWVYQPTLLNGNPIEVVTEADVNFILP